MKNSMKKAWVIAKINFRYLVPVYIITAAFIAIGIYNLVSCLTGLTGNTYVDMANYLYLLSVFAPVFIVARNFKRIMHINGSKHDFYWGALLGYSIIAAVVSFLGIMSFILTNTVFGSRLIILNLADVFGWWNRPLIITFIQQFSFLLLVEIFIHTITSLQNRWYGWIVDILLVIVICVFIPVPVLRNQLVRFFNIIIFHSNAMLQITCCLALSLIIYFVNWLILQRKSLN